MSRVSMTTALVSKVPLTLCPTARCEVGLTSDNRFHPTRLGFLVKLDRPEHVPVVGDRDRWHSEGPYLPDEWIDLIGAIQEAVLSVQM